ncbi:MAG: glycosyltransferase family 2 protein [Asticcacaulis sp.]
MSTDWQDQVAILEASGLMDDAGYLSRYADVRLLDMRAAEHYIKYGAAMGRNPSEAFNTDFYLTTYTDVAKSGVNPLLHYVLHGREEGRYGRVEDRCDPYRRIKEASRRLRVLGFADRPIEDLKAIIAETDDPAVQSLALTEIALWHLHKTTPENYAACLTYLEQAMPAAIDDAHRSRLILVRLLCHYHLQQTAQAHAFFNEVANLGLDSPEVCLARANFETTLDNRLQFINRALSRSNIPEIAFEDGNTPPYDRLTIATPPLKLPAEGHPKISVLIAAYNAAKTLPTALRSLQAQSWQNLEIIVIDDASTDNTAEVASQFATRDTRIKLLCLSENGGAYVARNAGLDQSSGEYVTLHDSDDWSHPLKLEIQARYLNADSSLIGCTSQQARASHGLEFTRCTDDGQLIFPNTSSLMFRRVPVQETCGYWDNVRFSADTELIRRIRKVFGHQAIQHLPTGPLSFQRHSSSSIVAHPAFGINGSPYGIRHEYFEAQHFHHKRATSLRYNNDPETRPFPAPMALQCKNAPPRFFDIILAADFRKDDPATQTAISDIKRLIAAGLDVGLVQLYEYDLDPNPHKLIVDDIRSLVDGAKCQVLAYGEQADCYLLSVRNAAVLQEPQAFLPDITAARLEVIADITTHNTDRVQCDTHIQHYFGKAAIWHNERPIETYIHEGYLQRKTRLKTLFDSTTSDSIFFTKLSTELLPAINSKIFAAINASHKARQEAGTLGENVSSPPLVSVIMPTFNRGSIIADAIQSVLDQTYIHWELFVCDDASTDNTEAVVKGFGDARIHYISLEKIGAAAARNVGLKNARGALIAYLDSDNYWHAEYLKTTVRTLNDHPDKYAVYSNYIDYQIREDGLASIESYRRPAFNFERLLIKNYIDLNTFAHRRILYDAFGGFNTALKRRQDYDLILKYTWLEDPLQIEEILALYQRNARLSQITQSEGQDMTCVEIIENSINTYLRSGLPINPVTSGKVSIVMAGNSHTTAVKSALLAQALSPMYETELIFPDTQLSATLPDIDRLYLSLHDLPAHISGLQGQVVLVTDMPDTTLCPARFVPISVTQNSEDSPLQAALFTGNIGSAHEARLGSEIGTIDQRLYQQRESHAAIRGRFNLFLRQGASIQVEKTVRWDSLFTPSD